MRAHLTSEKSFDTCFQSSSPPLFGQSNWPIFYLQTFESAVFNFTSAENWQLLCPRFRGCANNFSTALVCFVQPHFEVMWDSCCRWKTHFAIHIRFWLKRCILDYGGDFRWMTHCWSEKYIFRSEKDGKRERKSRCVSWWTLWAQQTVKYDYCLP